MRTLAIATWPLLDITNRSNLVYKCIFLLVLPDHVHAGILQDINVLYAIFLVLHACMPMSANFSSFLCRWTCTSVILDRIQHAVPHPPTWDLFYFNFQFVVLYTNWSWNKIFHWVVQSMFSEIIKNLKRTPIDASVIRNTVIQTRAFSTNVPDEEYSVSLLFD